MKLSVVVITRNHAAYIRQCLDSVLAQRLDVEWEVIVGDDASDDGASAIVEEYCSRHPERIQHIRHPVNVGLIRNIDDALAASHGEFVAYIDGDDYWTAPDKLSKQLALLDANPEAVLCFHATRLLTGTRLHAVLRAPGRRSHYSTRDLLRQNIIPAQSVVYRRTAMQPLPVWLGVWRAPPWDWYCNILATLSGPALYLNECLSVYRVHRSSSWSMKRPVERLNTQLTILERIHPLLPANLEADWRSARCRVFCKQQFAAYLPALIAPLQVVRRRLLHY